MGDIKIEGVTHWSIPVNNLEESEKFYGELLGLDLLGHLGNSIMTCFNVGDHNILLGEVEEPMEADPSVVRRLIRSGVLPARQACKGAPWLIAEQGLETAAVREALAGRSALPSDPDQQVLDLA